MNMPLVYDKKELAFEGAKVVLGAYEAKKMRMRFSYLYFEKHGGCLDALLLDPRTDVFNEYTTKEANTFIRYSLMYVNYWRRNQPRPVA